MNNCTHQKEILSFEEEITHLRQKILSRGNLSYVSMQKQLEILEQLSKFPLGRFFIERKGADGFWTDYIINYKKTININNQVERFILTKCPLTLATQDRFKIFQKEIQKHLRNGAVLASIPCGLMRDILTLDFSLVSDVSLIGIDTDIEAISLAKNLATQFGLEKNVKLLQMDAWDLKFNSELDLITSNGLNVYLDNKQKLLDLYYQFYKSLKKNGVLIIGFLTPPPGHSKYSGWNLDLLPDEDMEMEKILFQDILGCKWRHFTSIDDVRRDFSSVGFSKIQVIFDKYRIFPTVVARK